MNNIDTMSVNAIRVLSADAIQKAKSGHPGLPLGCASVAYELWAKHLKHNPKDPDWKDRDRFILSGGHGSMLLYSLLHLVGYGDLKKATAEVVSEKLAIFQEKYNKIMSTGIANEVLDCGRDYSIEVARKKYNIIRKVVGLGRI